MENQQVDATLVIQSLLRQIAQQAERIAILESLNSSFNQPQNLSTPSQG